MVALAAIICALGAWTTLRLLARARARDGGSIAAWVFLGGVAAELQHLVYPFRGHAGL